MKMEETIPIIIIILIIITSTLYSPNCTTECQEYKVLDIVSYTTDAWGSDSCILITDKGKVVENSLVCQTKINDTYKKDCIKYCD